MTFFPRRYEAGSGADQSLISMLQALPPGCRGSVLQQAISFEPAPSVEQEFNLGPIRAAFASYWETRYNSPLPIREFRRLLELPVPIASVLKFSGLMLARGHAEIDLTIAEIATHLAERLRNEFPPLQLSLIDTKSENSARPSQPFVGGTVKSLAELVSARRRFSTIYADPPWPYENEASRAAAINHYSTMSLEAIRAEPVWKLAEKNAHLHLWTTNAFLGEALALIDAWGFEFKSCLVWVKGDIGLGNYWRVSHEFLLLGIRGSLTFRDRTLPSWIQAERTVHSRKPGIVRVLVERVSPPPYLELYGREELPDSAWTVYGNEIERRLF
jgi:N6-adenosine-specific RNA methylase IME4